MSFNTVGAAQVSLELFGGIITEMPAMNLPPGVSPDAQDMAFKPGATFSRPGLVKVFATPLGSVTVTYAKSYVANDGTVRNLYLDSAGNLWVENVSSTPGTVSLLAAVTPGSYAKSITAFGREYIAFSDGLHGTEVPLQYDGTNLDRVTQDGPGTPPTVTNLIIPPQNLAGPAPHSLVRSKNVVTATTAAPHGLIPGNQVQITGVGAAGIGFISSIVIKNEDNPGIATVNLILPVGVTVSGLSPGLQVIIQGVTAAVVGTSIGSVTRKGEVVTVITTTPHGLQAGASVTLAGVTDVSFNTTMTVTGVQNFDQFTCLQVNTTDATSGSGTVNLNWPASGEDVQNLFEVLDVPSNTSFTVAIAYGDGVWSQSPASAAVLLPWDGIFYVLSTPTATTFTYRSQGQDGFADDVGLATPTGQAAPGQHQCQVSFLTRQGYVTQPSPPARFIANGGQYLQITNIAIGPPNVVARILEFTGSGGNFFFYIPVVPLANGDPVGTATQINDNTTTSVVLDFGDPTLFASLATSTQGNNLAAQAILDSALGFAFYGSRLITYGQRNVIQNLLNMGFDGGSITSGSPAVTQITGWTGTGTLVMGHFSVGVRGPNLTQSMYLDAYGSPIAEPNTLYKARAWISGTGVTVKISSASLAFSTSVVLTPGVGGWAEATFPAKTPATIPSDLILTLSDNASPVGTIVDNLSIFFAAAPFLDKTFFGSYVNNPEAFDGVSGVVGVIDVRKIMTVGIIRNAMYPLTQEPAGRLHVIVSNGTTEPAGWSTNEVAANCGALSTFCLTVSQADDATAGGGEEWMAWMSYSGARLFGGDQPWKISQEIQPDWDQINQAAWLTTWALNDPAIRRIYFGLPKGFNLRSSPSVLATAPNVIYQMDYKELDGAYAIAESPPIHLAFTGKLVARDHARKWCPWNIPMNGGAIIYRPVGSPAVPGPVPVFFAGNGAFPGTIPGGFGNVYSLGSTCSTDADYGPFNPYYTTYAFTNPDTEQGLQLGGQRHLLQYLTWNISGSGHILVTVEVDTITNAWPISATLPLRSDPTYDDEWGGGQASGQRMFIKFSGLP